MLQPRCLAPLENTQSNKCSLARQPDCGSKKLDRISISCRRSTTFAKAQSLRLGLVCEPPCYARYAQQSQPRSARTCRTSRVATLFSGAGFEGAAMVAARGPGVKVPEGPHAHCFSQGWPERVFQSGFLHKCRHSLRPPPSYQLNHWQFNSSSGEHLSSSDTKSVLRPAV